MTERQILEALRQGEARDWEFKSARGGLPASLWETSSAMANTDGGVIVLGVDQKGDRFEVTGLPDPAKMTKSFWDIVNNRGKVSVNLLSDEHVRIMAAEGKPVMVVQDPRADRRQRPVYIGQNPLEGTYRRNFEGDYHCSEGEVGRMLADRSEEPADSRILEHFGLDDLDPTTLRQYRFRFAARSPAHPWLTLDDRGLLEKLGGWRKDRVTGREGLTAAGLLMFGKVEAIRDPTAVPQYHVDYRERLSDDPKVRWTDRLTADGTWVANLFQFYERVVLRLTADLKVPFRLEADLQRKDDTVVHEAIREALVNALIHADYRGMGGIVIEKYRSRFEMSNPGTLLVSFEQLLRGGVSECRNKALQTMFQMTGFGEKAGSGIDKIRQGWASQHWRGPAFFETTDPDRVRLVLPMISLLPPESLGRLRQRFGARLDQLSALEVQALVTADLEGVVSNSRMRLICDEHAADLTRMFQGLVGRGFLDQHGQKRGTFYELPPITAPSPADSPPSGPSSPPSGAGSPLTGEDPALLALAQPARKKARLRPDQTRRIILNLCRGRHLTAARIAALMNRDPNKLRDRFLTPMTAEGWLSMQFPDDPTHPQQAYTARTVPENESP